MARRLSVVVPAHNEAGVLGALLTDLLVNSSATPGGAAVRTRFGADELEVVVVPNGCTDETADLARGFAGVVVSPIPTGSKIAALREGDRVATRFPRAYVDADVRIAPEALFALAEALATPDGPLVASPRLVVDTAGASWAVRQFFRVWELTDYRTGDHIGSGVYALSEQGRRRFADWPDVIADDRFVQQLFRPGERLTLAEHSFTVRSPRTLRAHLLRSVRIIRGNRELPRRLQWAALPKPSRHARLLGRVLRRPQLWPALAVYLATSALARVLAAAEGRTGRTASWHRDETTRTADDR